MHADRASLTKLKAKYGDETIFAAHTAHLTSVPFGFEYIPADANVSRFEEGGRYFLRYDLEENRTFQQVVLLTSFMNDRGKFYVVIDKDKYGQAGALSLFVGDYIHAGGGHSNVIQNNVIPCAENKASFELVKDKVVLSGTVRDSNNLHAMNRVGFVFTAIAKKIKLKDQNKKGKFMSFEDLHNRYYEFDDYSRMYINFLYLHQARA